MTKRRISAAHGPAAVFVLLALASLAGCNRSRPYTALTADAEPLRSQFNRDAGHVRVVMLVAPT